MTIRSSLFNVSTRAVVLGLLICFCTPISSPQSQPPAGTQEADAAAARKKKFEEDKQRLENGGALQDAPDPNQTLFVSPYKAGMVVGESRTFSVFDIDGKVLTSQTEWSVSDAGVADLAGVSGQGITAKSVGTVTVRARVGSRFAESTVTVYPGPKFPPVTVRWLAPPLPGFTLKKLWPGGIGVGPEGTAVCFEESDGQGGILLRWFTSDGRQIGMKRMPVMPHEDSPH